MASTLAARRPQPTCVLVPGCGTGAELSAAALAMPDALFTAIDPSQGMLDVARHKAKADGSHARIAFHHGLLDETGPDLHDAAMLSLVLHFLPDDGAKRDLLAGIARRLSAGAPLLLVDAVKPDDDDAALRDWLRRRGHSSAEASAVIERMQESWHRVPLERLIGLLEQAGFHIREPFFRAFGYLGILAERA
ncbi:class I SAM-dependent methyltransferase [Aurantiacibacter xanthus]